MHGSTEALNKNNYTYQPLAVSALCTGHAKIVQWHTNLQISFI